jgi:hypothetical protein
LVLSLDPLITGSTFGVVETIEPRNGAADESRSTDRLPPASRAFFFFGLFQALTRLATELPPASRAHRTGIPVCGFLFSKQDNRLKGWKTER